MMPALATAAIDALQAITTAKSKSKAAATAGVSQKTTNPSDVASTASTTTASATASTATATSSTKDSYKLAPGTMATLLDAQSQPVTAASEAKRADSLKRLMGMLDSDGSGGISQAEFANKLGAGGSNTANAEKVFATLDKNDDGSVNADELSVVLNGPKAPSSTTTGNSDGTTTTSMTYADGSTVSTTSAPTSTASTASSKASSSYNFVEQMIQRQANAIATSSSASALSISA
jgi:hypothetical protein